MKTSSIFLVSLAAVITLPFARAGQLDSISIDTSSLPASTSGYLDFTFNGGGTPFQPAIATISSFASTASLDASTRATAGTVTGVLPGMVSMANDNSEYLEALTFGSSLKFDLALSGPAVEEPNGSGSGSVFTLSLLNSTEDGAYLTSDVNDGFLLQININGAGDITSTTFPTASGGPSLVAITSTPEPAAALLVLAGLVLVVLFRRRSSGPLRVVSAKETLV